MGGLEPGMDVAVVLISFSTSNDLRSVPRLLSPRVLPTERGFMAFAALMDLVWIS